MMTIAKLIKTLGLDPAEEAGAVTLLRSRDREWRARVMEAQRCGWEAGIRQMQRYIPGGAYPDSERLLQMLIEQGRGK
jgi:hypothetical protein